MISEFILNIIFGIVSGMLALLPDISWNVDSSALNTFMDYVRVASYMLPMDTVGTIFGLVCAIISFRIIISLIKTIWELLPLV